MLKFIKIFLHDETVYINVDKIIQVKHYGDLLNERSGVYIKVEVSDSEVSLAHNDINKRNHNLRQVMDLLETKQSK